MKVVCFDCGKVGVLVERPKKDNWNHTVDVCKECREKYLEKLRE